MQKLVAGVDEAGRGCVLGPLVICIAIVEEEKEQLLKKIGAKDSKLLSPSARGRLQHKVREICVEAQCIHITAKQLNELMPHHSLNEIEAMKVAELLSAMKHHPESIIADSPDTDAKRFEHRIRKYLKRDLVIHSEHKADVNHPVVSGASILAKVERDAEIERIKGELNYEFGSGYSSDPRTIEFLKSNFHLPAVGKYLRTRWETVENLKQRKLSDAW